LKERGAIQAGYLIQEILSKYMDKRTPRLLELFDHAELVRSLKNTKNAIQQAITGFESLKMLPDAIVDVPEVTKKISLFFFIIY
jgi:hypothetical protein